MASGIEIALERDDTPADRVSAAIAVDGSRLTIIGGGINGWADAEGARARCAVPSRYIADPAALAADLLDTLVLFLLAKAGGRTPLHAAGVMIAGKAWILAGPSGAGKSTLALTAAMRGLPVLSEDTVHVQIEPSLRVWGLAKSAHIFPEEAPAGDHAVRLRAGKRKAVVPLPGQAGGVRYAESAELVLLSRGERVALEPVGAEVAKAELARLDAGFDLLARQTAEAVEVLAARGAWRLTLSDDPHAAIDLLLAHGLRE